MTRYLWLVALCACSSPLVQQRIGTGSVHIDGVDAGQAAWMVPASLFDDRMPDLPTMYLGWTVTFSNDPPNTSCDAVRYPMWTAQLVVYSTTRGSLPEDAPITPGTFPVAHFAAPPNAGIQVERPSFTGIADSGSVTVTEFDDDHIIGTFTGTGASSDLAPVAFTTDGSFTATRCDVLN